MKNQTVLFTGNPWRTPNNNRELLHKLLFLEEAEELHKLQRFNVADINIKYHTIPSDITRDEYSHADIRVSEGDTVLHAHVNRDFHENRPSLIANDIVIIWQVGTENIEFEGRVLIVKKREFLFIVSNEFKDHFKNFLPNFNLRFTSSRTQWRSLHRAVDDGDLSILNPMEEYQYGKVPKMNLQMKNLLFANQSLSHEQKKIVSDVVNFQYKGSPYLIVGPFGSGKTTTLVESIIQITRNITNAKILVATLTNSAANVLLEKLSAYFSPNELYRACSAYYKTPYVFPKFKAYTSYNEEKDIYELPIEEINSKKIIVTTCQLSSTLYGIGVKDFTHIILDEAGQVSMMEAMIPLCMVIGGEKDNKGKYINVNTNVILAGDHHQLGPVIFNKSARDHGFGESPIENLLKNKAWYTNTETMSKYMTKLTTQYRCCKQICDFPLNEFYTDYTKGCFTYQNDLIGERITPYPDFNRNLGLHSEFYPLVFCDVRGAVFSIPEVPGIINPIEACFVVKLVVDFIHNACCSDNEVAIICEQYSQRKCLMATLSLFGKKVFVGSVTSMQGKEYTYTFICTGSARTVQDTLNGKEKNGCWTPIDSIYRKINTAITRASELIMVIGDSTSLSGISEWNELIMFCKNKNSYVAYQKPINTSFFVNPFSKSNLIGDYYSNQTDIQRDNIINVDDVIQFPPHKGITAKKIISTPKLNFSNICKSPPKELFPKETSSPKKNDDFDFPSLIGNKQPLENFSSVWNKQKNKTISNPCANIDTNINPNGECSNSSSPPRKTQIPISSLTGNIQSGRTLENFPIPGISIKSHFNMTWKHNISDQHQNLLISIEFTLQANGFIFDSVEKAVNIPSCSTYECTAINPANEDLQKHFSFHLEGLVVERHKIVGNQMVVNLQLKPIDPDDYHKLLCDYLK